MVALIYRLKYSTANRDEQNAQRHNSCGQWKSRNIPRRWDIKWCQAPKRADYQKLHSHRVHTVCIRWQYKAAVTSRTNWSGFFSGFQWPHINFISEWLAQGTSTDTRTHTRTDTMKYSRWPAKHTNWETYRKRKTDYFTSVCCVLTFFLVSAFPWKTQFAPERALAPSPNVNM